MRRILLTARAEEDLIAIWLHIARDQPEAADIVLDSIQDRWRQLVRHPLSGPPREDIGPGMRKLVTHRYLTLYRVTDSTIEIVRVLHPRRKIDPDVLTDAD